MGGGGGRTYGEKFSDEAQTPKGTRRIKRDKKRRLQKALP